MQGPRSHYCDICEKYFHRKGIARHRKAHVKRAMGVIKAPMPKLRRNEVPGSEKDSE